MTSYVLNIIFLIMKSKFVIEKVLKECILFYKTLIPGELYNKIYN